MKKSRFTDSQIMAALKRVEAGLPIPEICRDLGISPSMRHVQCAMSNSFAFGGNNAVLIARRWESA